jgi:hypothetical protein
MVRLRRSPHEATDEDPRGSSGGRRSVWTEAAIRRDRRSRTERPEPLSVRGSPQGCAPPLAAALDRCLLPTYGTALLHRVTREFTLEQTVRRPSDCQRWGTGIGQPFVQLVSNFEWRLLPPALITAEMIGSKIGGRLTR